MTVDETIDAYLAAQDSHKWRKIGLATEWESQHPRRVTNYAAFYECAKCGRVALKLNKDYTSTSVSSFSFVDCFGASLKDLTCKHGEAAP